MHAEKIQTQSVGNNTETGQTHGGCPEHGVQRQTQGNKNAGGQGDADGIVKKGPEQILVDVPKGGPAEPDGGGNITQAAFHEDNVSRVNGHVGPRANGDPNVRPGERGSIVDTVPHHSDLPLLFQLPDDTLFPIGQDAGDYVIDASLFSDGLRCACIVSCQHHDLNPHGL